MKKKEVQTRKKFSIEQKQAVVKDLASGMPIREIMAKHGLKAHSQIYAFKKQVAGMPVVAVATEPLVKTELPKQEVKQEPKQEGVDSCKIFSLDKDICITDSAFKAVYMEALAMRAMKLRKAMDEVVAEMERVGGLCQKENIPSE